jgi:hypothetical protein
MFIAFSPSPKYNTTGSDNTANGRSALQANTTGSINTANGYDVLYHNTTGGSNTANGYAALISNTTGSNNTALGNAALAYNTTGSNNTALGSGADVYSVNLTNATAIGAGAGVSESNTVVMGNTFVTQFEFNGALMPHVGGTYTAGTSGQVLTSQGAGVAPQWSTGAGGPAGATGATGATGPSGAAGSYGDCPATFVVDHRAGAVAPENKRVTYGAILTSLTGSPKCWITQNLGATNQATSATDNTDNAAGWYWQFNSKQGYKHTSPNGGGALSPAWGPTGISETSDWFPGNDPCTIELGAGWRIPTYTEWSNANTSGAWTSYDDTYASVLKLHAAGYLDSSNGSLGSRGAQGAYWNSTQNDATYGWNLFFFSGNSIMSSGNGKACGYSVRCLRD